MITAPDYIQFYPAVRCDRSCGFCFNQRLPELRDMSYEAFCALADRMKGLGIGTLDILGGEPTLHKDLPRLVEYAVQKGLAINMSSNGQDPKQLTEIMYNHPSVQVGVSVNDRKTADRLARFIRNCSPIVKTVLGNHLDTVLADLLLSFRPKAYYLLYLDAMNWAQLTQTAPFDSFVRTVRAKYDPGQVGTVYCSGFLPDHEKYPLLLKARCPAGTTKLGVLPDGSVWPCNLFFGIEDYRLGNILTDPFEKIWQHPALTYSRTFAGNPCSRKDCELYRSCHGGCPAHSLVHAGKRSGPDPRCVRA